MNACVKVAIAAVLLGIGFAIGVYARGLSATAALASAQRDHAKEEGEWERQRAELANQRADAINARMIAEGKQANAIHEAAQSYAQGKADAEKNAKLAIDALHAGTSQLRDQWATCRATVATVAAAVPATGAGHGTDGLDQLREDGIRRVLSAVGQCQSQRDALQAALIGERQKEQP